MLFSNQRTHKIDLPSVDEKGDKVTIAYLVKYLCEEVMKDKRREMFVVEGRL